MGEHSEKKIQKVYHLNILFYLIINLNRGDWSFQEDMMILNYVENKGTKWAQITRKLQNRNEHNIKNRFFSLISEYLQMTVKDVKKKINYHEQELLRETIIYLHSANVVKQKTLSL